MVKVQILEKRYKILFPEDKGLSNSQIISLEKTLRLSFSEDLKKILSFFSGGMLGMQSLLDFEGSDEYSVAGLTGILRESIKLPHDFLVLYCEYGMIYVDCEKESQNYGHVLYCGTEDAQWLCDGIEPKYYWDYLTFSDFFEHLLDEEEKERAENVE